MFGENILDFLLGVAFLDALYRESSVASDVLASFEPLVAWVELAACFCQPSFSDSCHEAISREDDSSEDVRS